MATLQDYRNERLRKLAALRELGLDPYPAHTERTHDCATVVAQYDELAGHEVSVAGRVLSVRSFGKLAFVKLRDYFGEVQLFMKQEGEVAQGLISVKNLKLLDLGDLLKPKVWSENHKLAKFPSSPMPCAYSQNHSVRSLVATALLTKKNVIADAMLI